MNLYDKSSLILVPGAVKDGKVYSQRPENGDGDFTFTRGSNLAATRVDENGLIEKGRENLILQSNQFDTTWFNYNSTETGGQAGYDGSNDAWRIDLTGAAGYMFQSLSQAGIQTASVYAKAGTLNFVRFRITGAGADKFVDVNLTNGSIGTTGGGNIDSQAVSIGNGWYRISLSCDAPPSALLLHPIQADSDFTATSGSIYIQDAQLEQGLVATDYIETTTTTAQAGILEDMPRLDYSSGASCPSLLLEPQRTNSVTESEYYGTWTKNGTIVEQNEIVSPDGDVNAAKYQGDGTNSPKMLYTVGGSVTSGTKYTWSAFVKRGTLNFCQLIIGSATFDAALFSNFDLLNGTIGSSGGGAIPFIESYGNDWYRVGITATANANGTATPFIVLANSATMGRVSSFTTSDYIYIYGGHYEQGSYPTSYIPTYGTSVTRNSDACTKTGVSDLIGQTEGTIFLDFEFINPNKVVVLFTIHDNANNKRLELWANNNDLNGFIGGSVNIGIGNTTITNGRHKAAMAYNESGDQAFYVDGVQIGTSLTAYTIASLTGIKFNNHIGGGVYKTKEGVKQLLLFKTRLTNAELEALTTI